MKISLIPSFLAVALMAASLSVPAAQPTTETCDNVAGLIYVIALQRDNGVTKDELMEQIASQEGTLGYTLAEQAAVDIYSPQAANTSPAMLAQQFLGDCFVLVNSPEDY